MENIAIIFYVCNQKVVLFFMYSGAIRSIPFTEILKDMSCLMHSERNINI